MSIKKLVSPKTKGINVSNERVEALKINEIIDTLNGSNGLGYKKYTALLTQVGTDDPSVVILENTLGGIPTVTYSSDGNYFITLVGKWTSNKTGVFTAQLGSAIFSALILDNDAIIISTQNISTGTPIASNGLLNNSLIEIRIYP